MKAVAVMEAGRVEVVDIPIPECGEYECLVKVRACGLCNSTDLKIINNEISNVKVQYPIILGHEGVGEIVEKGSRVRNLKVGDIILSPRGKLAQGIPYKLMYGGMVQYGVIHDIKAMLEDGIELPFVLERYPGRKIPKEIGFEDAGVILTLKENYSALINFGIKPGMDVLVYGDGPVGMGLVNFSRVKNAGWIACVGHRKERLDKILNIAKADMVINSHSESVDEKLGDRHFDLIIDAVGKTDIIKQAAKRMKPGGKVGCYGVLKPSDSTIDLLDLPNNINLHMLNWPYREHDTQDEIIDMILTGKINPKDYYSHVLPVEEAARAVKMVETREAYKVVLKM